MLIKSASDRSSDVAALQALLARPDLSTSTRTGIEKEIKTIRGGEKGERDAAYEIDFHHKNSDRWAVIHDLRLEWQGRTAQIDHLVINRFLDIWVCESKSFSEGVSINEEGEFTRFFNRRPVGLPSPLEQNRKHIEVLKSVLASSLIQLPTRLGLPIRPTLESVVLIANGARISRPKASVPGLERVIHTDKFRSLVERSIDDASALATLGSAFKLIGSETLETFARQLAALHRPIVVDWQARFGLSARESETSAPASGSTNRLVAREPISRIVQPPVVNNPPAVVARADVAPPNAREDLRGGDNAATVSNSHEGRLSSSKLAATRGLNTKQLLDALAAAGYLLPNGDGFRLSEKAVAVGAVHIEKSRYGPYFLWPVDLVIDASTRPG